MQFKILNPRTLEEKKTKNLRDNFPLKLMKISRISRVKEIQVLKVEINRYFIKILHKDLMFLLVVYRNVRKHPHKKQ